MSGAESTGPGIPLERLCYRRQVTKPLWASLFKDSVDSGSEAYAQHGCGLQWVPHRWSCAGPRVQAQVHPVLGPRMWG